MRLSLLAITTLLPASVLAEVVSYHGTAFPDDVGWIRLPQPKKFLADRFIEEGWFVQTPQIIDGKPGNQLDNYRWNLTEQAGAQVWFLEWTMVTDGPASFGAVAPAGIVAAGQSGILYHFTIAVDELVFKRGSQFPLVFHSFKPGIHQFRLELRNDPPTGTFVFTMDGKVIDAGEAEGFYPTADSFVVFGCQADIVDSETRWDRIEFGDPTAAVPATSEWGCLVFSILLTSAATILFRRTTRASRFGFDASTLP